jgi:hypothetical protein
MSMPKKAHPSTTEQLSITLPSQAVVIIEQLVTIGLHGSSRGEVARTLILSRLEQLIANKIINLSVENDDHTHG